MKIGPGNAILELFKFEKMSMETHVLKTAPASYTLPLQTAPDPLSAISVSMYTTTSYQKNLIIEHVSHYH